MANHTASLPQDKQIAASVGNACSSVMKTVLGGDLKVWGVIALLTHKMSELRKSLKDL